MGTSFLKNFFGLTITDDEMGDIPYPNIELTAHVIIKDMQAFGTLGTLIFGPLIAVSRSSTRNSKEIIRKSTQFGKYGLLAGLFVGPLMNYGLLKKKNATQDSIYDRCYRLRYNKNQLRVDRAWVYGGATGMILFPLFLKMCPTFGCLVGMSTGAIGMGLYNSKSSPKNMA